MTISSTANETIITITANIDSRHKDEFVNWQSKLNTQIALFPGFVSLEIILPTESEKNKWIIVERFQNTESMNAWNNSKQDAQLIQELRQLTSDNRIERELLGELDFKSGGITEVFVTEVSHEKEKEFRKWTAEIHKSEAKFPGFKGIFVQSPLPGKGKTWLTFIQFDTAKNLDRWLESDERKEVLKKSENLISSIESHRIVSPYAGWFSSIAKTGKKIPAAWQQSMIVLLVLFPIVMLEFKYLNPLIKPLNISLSTFIGNAISVALLAWPAVPIAIWLLTWWLVPESEGKKRTQTIIAGTVLVLLMYLIEIFIFWSFI